MIRKTLNWLAPWKAGGCRWLHAHLLWLAALTIAFVLVVAGVGYSHHVTIQTHRAGFIPATPTVPVVRAIGGYPLPQHYSLARFIRFENNQDASNACVGETVSEALSLTEAERGHTIHLSPAFVWAPFGGYGNVGITYDQAFGRAEQYGVAPYSAFPYGGNGYWYYATQPDNQAYTAATPYKVASFGPVLATDTYTIKSDIAHGYPVAVALAWHDTLVNWHSSALVTADYGGFNFWHSTLGVAYDAAGIYLLNSWGDPQLVHVSWGVLASDSDGVSPPTVYEWRPTRDVPIPKWLRPKKIAVFNVAGWVAYTSTHHKRALPFQGKGHLARMAWSWANDKHAGVKGWGSPKSKSYDRKRHLMTWRFTKGTAWVYLKYRHQPVKFKAGKR